MHRLLALGLVIIGCNGAVGDTGSTTETYDGPFTAVIAETNDGRIEVVAGPAGEEVVTVEFLPNGSDTWTADEGDTLTLLAACLGDDVVGCGGGFILTVPPDQAVDAQTQVGDINLGAGLSGELTAQTASSSINASDLGAASITALSGTGPLGVSFAETPTSVDLDSGSSPIAVSVPGGAYALDLDTGGAIDQDAAITDDAGGPQLRAHSGTGDITISAL